MIYKIISISLILILIVNLILFGKGTIPALAFWITIAIIAIITYFVIPRIKSQIQAP
ncbi:hypothetical protein ACFLZX_05575 [Nanoarchaeota archaeon]